MLEFFSKIDNYIETVYILVLNFRCIFLPQRPQSEARSITKKDLEHLCNQPAGNINRCHCQQMGVLLPPRFAPRDQDDNCYLQALVSKIDIDKLALCIQHQLCCMGYFCIFMETNESTRHSRSC